MNTPRPDPHPDFDPIDPLEIKLGKLRPRPMSGGLRKRIADVVADLPDEAKPDQTKPDPTHPAGPKGEPGPFPMRPSLRIWLGVAAGVVCAVSVGMAVNAILNPPPPREPQSAMATEGTDGALRDVTKVAPTLLNYLHAASQNDEALDLLLDKQTQVLLKDSVDPTDQHDQAATQPKP